MGLARPTPPLVLGDDEVQQFQGIANFRSLLHSIVQRAQIVLACGAGEASTAIAKRMGHRPTLFSAKPQVIQVLFISDRFEVGGHLNAIQSCGDDQLQLVAEVMVGLLRPPSGHEPVEGDEST